MERILVGAIVGIMAAIVVEAGFFLFRKITGKETKGAHNTAIVFALIAMSNSAPIRDAVKNFIFPPTPFERVVVGQMLDAAKTEEVQKLFRATANAESSRNLLFELVKKGMPRLTDADHLIRGKLLYKISMANSKICADLWTGKIADREFAHELELLPAADLETWGRISASSIILGADESLVNRPVKNGEELLVDYLSKFPDADGKKLSEVFSRGLGASPDEGCWAVRKLYGNLNLIRIEDAAQILRFMMAAG